MEDIIISLSIVMFWLGYLFLGCLVAGLEAERFEGKKTNGYVVKWIFWMGICWPFYLVYLFVLNIRNIINWFKNQVYYIKVWWNKIS